MAEIKDENTDHSVTLWLTSLFICYNLGSSGNIASTKEILKSAGL